MDWNVEFDPENELVTVTFSGHPDYNALISCRNDLSESTHFKAASRIMLDIRCVSLANLSSGDMHNLATFHKLNISDTWKKPTAIVVKGSIDYLLMKIYEVYAKDDKISRNLVSSIEEGIKWLCKAPISLPSSLNQTEDKTIF
jgi:hypothetical protein